MSKQPKYCESRSRDIADDGKVWPWMVCTRLAAKEGVSRNGNRYPVCWFHYREIREDARFVAFDNIEKSRGKI